MPLGIRPNHVVALLREAQRGAGGSVRVVVSGARAVELADALAAGGDRSRVVVAGDPSGAGAVIRLIGAEPTAEDAEVLRAGARAGAHLVAVRPGGDDDVPVPYVLATDVVVWPEAEPVPVAAVAAALARGLGEDVAALASALPAVREAAARRTILQAAVGAAGIVVVAGRSAATLPALSLAQAAMLRRLRVLGGQAAPAAPDRLALGVGTDLAAAVATGVVCRGLVRRLPVGGRLVQSAVAFAGTAGLGALARRRPPLP